MSVCHAHDFGFRVLNFPLLLHLTNACSFLPSLSTLHFTTLLFYSLLSPLIFYPFFHPPLVSLLFFSSRLFTSLLSFVSFLSSSSSTLLCSPRIRNGSRLTPNILFGGPAPVSDAVTSVPKARNAFERHKAAMKCVLHNLIMFFFNCLQLILIVCNRS